MSAGTTFGSFFLWSVLPIMTRTIADALANVGILKSATDTISHILLHSIGIRTHGRRSTSILHRPGPDCSSCSHDLYRKYSWHHLCGYPKASSCSPPSQTPEPSAIPKGNSLHLDPELRRHTDTLRCLPLGAMHAYCRPVESSQVQAKVLRSQCCHQLLHFCWMFVILLVITLTSTLILETAYSIFVDLYLAIYPMTVLWGLQINRPKKIGLSCVLGLGIL